MRKKLFFILVTILFIPWAAKSGGYQVGLHGQKQIGMGLVGTSLIFDASCMFYNPGGLSYVESKWSISFGMSPILGYTTFQKTEPSVYKADTDNPMGTPFYFYAAYKINEKLSVGVAVNTPYGNSLKWEDNWAGRFLIKEISLSAIFIQPTVSYKINDYIGVGAGFVLAMGSFNMTQGLPLQGTGGEGDVTLDGKTNSFGYNVGVQIRATDKLDIGIDYRSEILMEVSDADAMFSVPASLQTNFPVTNKVATTLPLPANLDFGVSYQASEKLLLGLSLNYVFWSVYESLDFDFATNTDGLQDSKNKREYQNTLITRIGGQYTVNETVAVRAGFYYDPTPTNENYFSPETPSLNNLGFTCGFSVYPTDGISIDASFLYIMGLEAEKNYQPDNFGGTYKTNVFVPGLGLTIDL